MEYQRAKSELCLLGQEIEVKNNITIENEKEGSIWAYIYIGGGLLILVLMQEETTSVKTN